MHQRAKTLSWKKIKKKAKKNSTADPQYYFISEELFFDFYIHPDTDKGTFLVSCSDLDLEDICSSLEQAKACAQAHFNSCVEQLLTPDYTQMPEHLLAGTLGTDAAKWAIAFQQIIVDKNVAIDEDLMLGWFANAIEAAKPATSEDKLKADGAERVMDDALWTGRPLEDY